MPDESNEEQRQGKWRREGSRLHAEIAQRFVKNRNEGIIPTQKELDYWLESLKKNLLEIIRPSNPEQMGRYLGPK